MCRLLCPLILLAVVLYCNAYKILIISSMPGTSHTILGHGLVRHITKGGHQVTYVTSMPRKDPWPNVTQIDVGPKLEEFMHEAVNVQKILDKENDVSDMDFIFKMMNEIFVMTLESDNMQRIMNDPKENFDLIIAEWVLSDLYAGLPAIFDCPFIWFSTVEPHWMILNIIDELPNPAYIPDVMSSNVPPFTFVQRFQELFYQIRGLIYQYFSFHPTAEMYYQKIIAPIAKRRGKPVPSFEELRSNVSLVLGNSHVSLGLPTRLPQSYKAIGGYHIESDVKPLPRDLQMLMDKADSGVIYFSLGSNLKSKDLPTIIKKALLEMFSKLKQIIIWKFEEALPDAPKNVHIVQWAPQPSILAHPNCVLFITHGGYLSSTETIHFGVPIIGVPVYGDQFNNIDRAVSKGYALKVELTYDLASDLKKAIDEILTNPKYRKRVKELSLIYHDRPVSPCDEVSHWVEHVIRTGGAPHLRSPALSVPWYKKVYLDLAALCLVALVALKALIGKLTKMLWSHKGTKSSNKKKKN